MTTLILMRHANAEPGQIGLTDFQRPLSSSGKVETKSTANQLLAAGLKIDQVFCSPARRTRETLAGICEIIPINDSDVIYEPTLYSGDVEAYQIALSTAKDESSILIIGHNPMVERFALETAVAGNIAGLNKLKFGFLTGAIAVIETKTGILKYFFTAD